MRRTESQCKTKTKLRRIAWLSERDTDKEFECLMHYYNAESLKECFKQLDAKKAVGIDKVTKEDYAKNLEENIEKLLIRMKQMAYRPGPVRQTMIPKASGAMRSLGVSNFEDKIVQKMTKKVLESIYEPIFKESSYGFRVNKGCHTAIKALQNYLHRNDTEIVIDVDIKRFFDSIDHKLLESMLRWKIKDTRFMRYIVRMFKAGVLSKGELKISHEGIAQGSICSPILANIYAHYVIDTWLEEIIQAHLRNKIAYFRYGDDMCICCQSKEDAIRIKSALEKRLAKYKLTLNEEKTKLVSFSKRAYTARREKQGTFDFLGFTFYIARTRKGYPTAKLKTSRKRKRDKLKNVNKWAKEMKNKYPLPYIWNKFRIKLRGHVQYYGVSHNTDGVREFVYRSSRILYGWLNRRSQRKSWNWEKWNLFVRKNPLPTAKIYHKLF